MSAALLRRLTAFASGALFGAGLLVAGMTDPARVVAFLDVAGTWDPSLALVMVGAIGVYGVALRLILHRPQPLFDPTFHLPLRRRVDHKLLRGAAIFGVGWGLAGYCPGPGLVAAAAGSPTAMAFAIAMVIGMLWQAPAAARTP